MTARTMAEPWSPRELEVLARRIRGDDWKAIAAAMELPIGTLSGYQSRGLEKLAAIELDSLDGLKIMAENVQLLFRQTPDGRPVTLPGRMSREDVDTLRAAAKGLAAGTAKVMQLLARLEGDDGQAR